MKYLSLALLGLVAALSLVSAAGAGPNPGSYSYDQAVALGIADPAEFARPDGMPDCPALPDPLPGIAPDAIIPDDVPQCYLPPEAQGLEFLVLPAGDPGYQGDDNPPIQGGQFRVTGSNTETSWRGGFIAAQVSNPQVCHGPCAAREHFYARVSATSAAGHNMKVGWTEQQHFSGSGCQDLDDQVVMTITKLSGAAQNPACHRSFGLQLGEYYAFAALHCGNPGQNQVCMQIYVPTPPPGHWVNLRTWQAMRCLNENWTYNCMFNFRHEMFSSNGGPWFALRTGPSTGLHMRNIHVLSNSGWSLFRTNGSWTGNASPYLLETAGDYYHFCTYYLTIPTDCG